MGSLCAMNPYLVKSLEFGPAVLERIVKVIPATRYDEQTSPDRFTLREAVAHLADFEPIFRGRMEDALRNPGVTVEPKDEEQMAIDHDYASQDLIANLNLFIEERRKTAELLRGLSPDGFETPLNHPHLGPLVLEDIANFLLAHDLYHLEHASQILEGLAVSA